MKVSFKYQGQMVIMDDSAPVNCGDELISALFENMQAVETVMLAGDVTQSPVANVLEKMGDEITDLEYLPNEIIH